MRLFTIDIQQNYHFDMAVLYCKPHYNEVYYNENKKCKSFHTVYFDNKLQL